MACGWTCRCASARLRVCASARLRVFYPGYYPTLTRLYADLGVATEAVSYATTFTGGDGRAFALCAAA